jgi:hypothetical protein
MRPEAGWCVVDNRDPADMETRRDTVGRRLCGRPDERLSWARTIGTGAQHVVAMFGATFLVPVRSQGRPSR